mmetsp:Transcript_98105/g.245892  ORF Transcript_98105/g.245892 Transcript_98105/m.245892 type:complete len:228 (+) Transcript_98105:634-1317(+)
MPSIGASPPSASVAAVAARGGPVGASAAETVAAGAPADDDEGSESACGMGSSSAATSVVAAFSSSISAAASWTSAVAAVSEAAAACAISQSAGSWTWPHGHTSTHLPSPERKFSLLGGWSGPSPIAARASAAIAARDARDFGLAPSPSPLPSARPKPPPSPSSSLSPPVKPWNWLLPLPSADLPLWLQKRWNLMYWALSSPYNFQKFWSCGPQTLCVNSWIKVLIKS